MLHHSDPERPEEQVIFVGRSKFVVESDGELRWLPSLREKFTVLAILFGFVAFFLFILAGAFTFNG